VVSLAAGDVRRAMIAWWRRRWCWQRMRGIDSHCCDRRFGAVGRSPSMDGHWPVAAPRSCRRSRRGHLTRPTAAIGAGIRLAIGIKEEHLHIITRKFAGAFEASGDGAARPGATSTKHNHISSSGAWCQSTRHQRCALVALRSVGGMGGCLLPSSIFSNQNECHPPSLPRALGPLQQRSRRRTLLTHRRVWRRLCKWHDAGMRRANSAMRHS